MSFCVIDAATREYAHQQGLQAEQDDYITELVSEALSYEPLAQRYLDAATKDNWHPALTRLVMAIEKRQLNDDDYHGIHEEAVELIRAEIEGETP